SAFATPACVPPPFRFLSRHLPPRECEEDGLEIWVFSPQISNGVTFRSEATKNFARKLFASAIDGYLVALPLDSSCERKRRFVKRVFKLKDHASVSVRMTNQLPWFIKGDDGAPIHDQHAIAKAFSFFHVVSGQNDRFAARADVPDQLPHRMASLRIQTGC